MHSTAAESMAKKKAVSPRDDWERKPLALQMRGAPEWKAWLERAANFGRVTVAQFIDQAAAREARALGFEEPPPKR